MHSRIIQDESLTGVRMMNMEQTARYIGLGLTKTKAWVKEVGAMTKIGGRTLVDRIIIDEALDQLFSKGS